MDNFHLSNADSETESGLVGSREGTRTPPPTDRQSFDDRSDMKEDLTPSFPNEHNSPVRARIHDPLSLLPQEFSANVTVLSLSHSQLQSIDERFLPFVNITTLNLSYNEISTLPIGTFWSKFTKLQFLFLHNNSLNNLANLLTLQYAFALQYLTAYDNPVAEDEVYRHVVVNRLQNLRCLDDFVIADEELVETAQHIGRFAKLSKNMQVFRNDALMTSNNTRQGEISQEMENLMNQVNHISSFYSPITVIQKYARGFITRRQVSRILEQKREADALLRHSIEEQKEREPIEKGVLLAQKIWRGIQTRRKFEIMRLEDFAARIIQHFWRRYRFRRSKSIEVRERETHRQLTLPFSQLGELLKLLKRVLQERVNAATMKERKIEKRRQQKELQDETELEELRRSVGEAFVNTIHRHEPLPTVENTESRPNSALNSNLDRRVHLAGIDELVTLETLQIMIEPTIVVRYPHTFTLPPNDEFESSLGGIFLPAMITRHSSLSEQKSFFTSTESCKEENSCRYRQNLFSSRKGWEFRLQAQELEYKPKEITRPAQTPFEREIMSVPEQDWWGDDVESLISDLFINPALGISNLHNFPNIIPTWLGSYQTPSVYMNITKTRQWKRIWEKEIDGAGSPMVPANRPRKHGPSIRDTPKVTFRQDQRQALRNRFISTPTVPISLHLSRLGQDGRRWMIEKLISDLKTREGKIVEFRKKMSQLNGIQSNDDTIDLTHPSLLYERVVSVVIPTGLSSQLFLKVHEYNHSLLVTHSSFCSSPLFSQHFPSLSKAKTHLPVSPPQSYPSLTSHFSQRFSSLLIPLHASYIHHNLLPLCPADGSTYARTRSAVLLQTMWRSFAVRNGNTHPSRRRQIVNLAAQNQLLGRVPKHLRVSLTTETKIVKRRRPQSVLTRVSKLRGSIVIQSFWRSIQAKQRLMMLRMLSILVSGVKEPVFFIRGEILSIVEGMSEIEEEEKEMAKVKQEAELGNVHSAVRFNELMKKKRRLNNEREIDDLLTNRSTLTTDNPPLSPTSYAICKRDEEEFKKKKEREELEWSRTRLIRILKESSTDYLDEKEITNRDGLVIPHPSVKEQKLGFTFLPATHRIFRGIKQREFSEPFKHQITLGEYDPTTKTREPVLFTLSSLPFRKTSQRLTSADSSQSGNRAVSPLDQSKSLQHVISRGTQMRRLLTPEDYCLAGLPPTNVFSHTPPLKMQKTPIHEEREDNVFIDEESEIQAYSEAASVTPSNSINSIVAIECGTVEDAKARLVLLFLHLYRPIKPRRVLLTHVCSTRPDIRSKLGFFKYSPSCALEHLYPLNAIFSKESIVRLHATLVIESFLRSCQVRAMPIVRNKLRFSRSNRITEKSHIVREYHHQLRSLNLKWGEYGMVGGESCMNILRKQFELNSDEPPSLLPRPRKKRNLAEINLAGGDEEQLVEREQTQDDKSEGEGPPSQKEKQTPSSIPSLSPFLTESTDADQFRQSKIVQPDLEVRPKRQKIGSAALRGTVLRGVVPPITDNPDHILSTSIMHSHTDAVIPVQSASSNFRPSALPAHFKVTEKRKSPNKIQRLTPKLLDTPEEAVRKADKEFMVHKMRTQLINNIQKETLHREQEEQNAALEVIISERNWSRQEDWAKTQETDAEMSTRIAQTVSREESGEDKSKQHTKQIREQLGVERHIRKTRPREKKHATELLGEVSRLGQWSTERFLQNVDDIKYSIGAMGRERDQSVRAGTVEAIQLTKALEHPSNGIDPELIGRKGRRHSRTEVDLDTRNVSVYSPKVDDRDNASWKGGHQNQFGMSLGQSGAAGRGTMGFDSATGKISRAQMKKEERDNEERRQRMLREKEREQKEMERDAKEREKRKQRMLVAFQREIEEKKGRQTSLLGATQTLKDTLSGTQRKPQGTSETRERGGFRSQSGNGNDGPDVISRKSMRQTSDIPDGKFEERFMGQQGILSHQMDKLVVKREREREMEEKRRKVEKMKVPNSEERRMNEMKRQRELEEFNQVRQQRLLELEQIKQEKMLQTEEKGKGKLETKIQREWEKLQVQQAKEERRLALLEQKRAELLAKKHEEMLRLARSNPKPVTIRDLRKEKLQEGPTWSEKGTINGYLSTVGGLGDDKLTKKEKSDVLNRHPELETVFEKRGLQSWRREDRREYRNHGIDENVDNEEVEGEDEWEENEDFQG